MAPFVQLIFSYRKESGFRLEIAAGLGRVEAPSISCFFGDDTFIYFCGVQVRSGVGVHGRLLLLRAFYDRQPDWYGNNSVSRGAVLGAS